MTIDELPKKLKAMYGDPATDKAVSVHLFGIRYAEHLDGKPLKDIAERAAIPVTYATEIRKGINLARYVREK
jgi:hypothetical protein